MEAGTGLMSPHSWRKLGVAPCKQCKKPVGVSGEFGFCSVHCRLKMLADKRAARDQRIRAQEYLEATAKEAQRKARLAANQARERQTMMAVEKAQRIAEAIGVVCKVCKEVRRSNPGLSKRRTPFNSFGLLYLTFPTH
jgi:endogenous inhibitor of DNA gyrase (YacG/DUF329 family)